MTIKFAIPLNMLLLLLALFTLGLRFGDATSCPDTASASETTTPLYLLALLSKVDKIDVLALPGLRIARDEVNNRTDMLPGYRIELIVDDIEPCTSFEAGIGLSNLVKHTVNPPCHPVVAVLLLGCSSHTLALSPVAGHDGYDLLQLSSANSPIFRTQFQKFPHLWKFYGSATVLADTLLAIMNQYNWTRVGLVYSVESLFYSGVAKYVEQAILKGSNKNSIVFSLGIRGTKSYYLDAAVSHIKDTEATVLVSLLNMRESHALLSKTYQNKLVYPQYIWIHIGKSYDLYRFWFDLDFVYKTAFGHILLNVNAEMTDESTVLVSNNTFASFAAKYTKDLKELQYPRRVPRSVFSIVGAKLYDPMWALALALNNSLPVLKNRNLSIDNYTIGQPKITAIIEEQMAKIKFQGAGGWVEFDQYRSVSIPVKVFWISANRSRPVGIYNPLHSSDFYVDIPASKLPKDTILRVYEYVFISLPVAILLYILTGVVTVFTTVQLILYLHYRHHKVIKATSPCLSLLMFAGCYLFCAACIVLITCSSFLLSPKVFTALSIVNFLLITNGISLTLITLFVNLLRLNRIFMFWMNKDLGKWWNNLPLSITILLVSIIPDIGLAIFVSVRPPKHSLYIVKFLTESTTIYKVHMRIEPISNYVFIGLAAVYSATFLSMVLCMALRNRKIKMANFNLSGPMYLLLAVLVMTICLAASGAVLFFVRGQEPIANVILFSLLLIFATACQGIFFLPKIHNAAFCLQMSKHQL